MFPAAKISNYSETAKHFRSYYRKKLKPFLLLKVKSNHFEIEKVIIISFFLNYFVTLQPI